MVNERKSCFLYEITENPCIESKENAFAFDQLLKELYLIKNDRLV